MFPRSATSSSAARLVRASRSSSPRSGGASRDGRAKPVPLHSTTSLGVQSRHPRHKAKLPARATPSEQFRYATAKSNHPWKEWVTFEVGHKEGAASAPVVRRLIGMGTWLLRGMLSPEFEFLVSEIEGLWRQVLEDKGFALLPFDKKLKLLDSMDKDGSKGEAFSRESDNPLPTDPDYPRMFMENRMYASDKFSKLHMGVGIRQDGLQFVHCLMIPKMEYDIPIFSVELIGMKRISLALVDLFPVTQDQTLSSLYSEGMELLQRESISSNRPIPNWATAVTSPFAVAYAPKDDDDSVRFLSYAALLSKVYMKTSEIHQPISSSQILAEIKSAHERFLFRSREQEQLRLAIEKSFGSDWTQVLINPLIEIVYNEIEDFVAPSQRVMSAAHAV